jgi:ABC-type transporter Mla maintaining outer membrane lipid asymmetry ATPase subunit MlaF
MNDPLIQTHDLTVFYGRQRGILNVNLTVERGEVFGFLGSNGAGKTITLRWNWCGRRATKGARCYSHCISCQKSRQIDVLILLGMAAAFFALALFGFQRRNVTVGAWPWQQGATLPQLEQDEQVIN